MRILLSAVVIMLSTCNLSYAVCEAQLDALNKNNGLAELYIYEDCMWPPPGPPHPWMNPETLPWPQLPSYKPTYIPKDIFHKSLIHVGDKWVDLKTYIRKHNKK